MHRIRLFGLFIFLTLFCILSSWGFAAEELTITTYYPSPYGSYNELQFYPHGTAVTTCSTTTKGTAYYDSDGSGDLLVCDGTYWKRVGPWEFNSEPMDTSTSSPYRIRPKSADWNVSIGTTSDGSDATAKLNVVSSTSQAQLAVNNAPNSYGVWANVDPSSGYAGYFSGKVGITNNLIVDGNLTAGNVYVENGGSLGTSSGTANICYNKVVDSTTYQDSGTGIRTVACPADEFIDQIWVEVGSGGTAGQVGLRAQCSKIQLTTCP